MSTVGIDFGTATTAVAISNGAAGTRFVRDQQGKEVIPSVLAFTPNQRTHAGFAAKARLLIDAPNTLHSFKRILGRTWSAPAVQRFRQQYPSLALEPDDRDLPRFATRAGKLSVTDVVAQFLATFRELEPLAQAPATRTTLSIPVSSGQAQREALVEAATRAGFVNLALIEEPYAAALGHHGQLGAASKEQIALVYDLGGGTFDAAVVAYHQKKIRLLALGGDPYLGGDDIDLVVAEWAAQRILEEHRCDVRSDLSAWLGLVMACERAKIRLSEIEATTLDLSQIDPKLTGKDLRITRAQFVPLFSKLVRKTFIVCDDVLGKAGLVPSQIDMLVLSGGCCHIPSIRSGVEHYVGRPDSAKIAPDRLCAVGTLVHALEQDSGGFQLAPIPAEAIA